MGGYTLIYPLNDEILSNEFKIEEYRIKQQSYVTLNDFIESYYMLTNV